MKVLNLYAGIGGNRKLWPDDEIEVTAVELNPKIAEIYKDFFPDDQVIVADAHKFLLEHYKEYDFIWSSPPCPSHSVCNNFLNAQGVVRYPDMKLYQEILFLKHFFKEKWVVENVVSYYEPLIKPQHSGRHYFWSNFYIPNNPQKNEFNTINARKSTRTIEHMNIKDLEKLHGFDISNYNLNEGRKALRNCVKPTLGLHIFNCAFKEKQEVLIGL